MEFGPSDPIHCSFTTIGTAESEVRRIPLHAWYDASQDLVTVVGTQRTIANQVQSNLGWIAQYQCSTQTWLSSWPIPGKFGYRADLHAVAPITVSVAGSSAASVTVLMASMVYAISIAANNQRSALYTFPIQLPPSTWIDDPTVIPVVPQPNPSSSTSAPIVTSSGGLISYAPARAPASSNIAKNAPWMLPSLSS
jgi:hypothetical protein